jgi:hypothetical protein
VLVVAGCGAPSPAGAPPAPETTHGPLPLSQVFVLEAAGILPDDTTVTVPARASRVVVLRRAAPDFGLFARMEFGDSALAPLSGDSARIVIHPIPGEYGLDLDLGGTLHERSLLIFSYGAHFLAPAGSRDRYGSDLAFEQALAIGRVENGQVVFLPTSRPGTDMLRAPINGGGRYVVGAPR